MPYTIVHQENGTFAIAKNYGGKRKIVGHSDSMEMAKKAVKARLMAEHNPEAMRNR